MRGREGLMGGRYEGEGNDSVAMGGLFEWRREEGGG